MAGREVAVREEDIKKFAAEIVWPKRNAFDNILPDTVDTDAFVGLVVAALYKAPKTAAVAMRAPESLMVAMRECASLGLMPNSDEYAFTVRDGQILGVVQYQGEIKRMYMFGTVVSVHADVICEGEEFIRQDPLPPIHRFKRPRNKNVDNLVGAYAYAILQGGYCSRIIDMDRPEIMRHREMAGFYGIWDGPFGHTMWTKTCVHELEKWVPKSSTFLAEQARANLAQFQAAPTLGPTQDYASAPVSVSVARPSPPDATSATGGPSDVQDGEIVEDPPVDDPWATVEVAKPGGGAPKK